MTKRKRGTLQRRIIPDSFFLVSSVEFVSAVLRSPEYTVYFLFFIQRCIDNNCRIV